MEGRKKERKEERERERKGQLEGEGYLYNISSPIRKDADAGSMPHPMRHQHRLRALEGLNSKGPRMDQTMNQKYNRNIAKL